MKFMRKCGDCEHRNFNVLFEEWCCDMDCHLVEDDDECDNGCFEGKVFEYRVVENMDIKNF